MVHFFVLFISVHCVLQFLSESNVDARSSFELSRSTAIGTTGSRFRKYADGLVYIPYYIEEEKFSEDSVEKILAGFAHFQSRTCLRFTKITSFDQNYTYYFGNSSILYLNPILYPEDEPHEIDRYFTTEDGKTIYYVTVNEYEEMSFFGIGRIKQLLFYALGFPPENLRPDRDNFVTVLWENIQPGKEELFRRQYYNPDTSYYDYRSISHFYPEDFGEDGKITLISKNPYTPIQRNIKLSIWDLDKIKRWYCN